jgi:hypothetical protein
MTRITNPAMAQWKPTPPPRETVAELKATAARNIVRLKQMEAVVQRARAMNLIPVAPLQPPPPPPPPKDTNNLHFEAIYKAVRDDFGVERETLEGRGRHPKVIAARRALVWLARKRTLLSFPEICKAMGRTGRGHSTMVDQFHTAEAMMDQPMYPGTAETFAEYFFRFSQRAWAFKPRSPSVANPPTEQGK